MAVLDDDLAPKRAAIITSMKDQGVGTSVYYPVPIPLSLYYQQKYGARAEDFPQAVRISHKSIALPVGPHLETSDMPIIADALARAIKGARL